MICNRCVKQDVCIHRELTERQEKEFSDHANIEIDCKFREKATPDQLSRIKQRANELAIDESGETEAINDMIRQLASKQAE